jgi:predicted RNA-binding Zn ribbon-like protein
MGHVQAENAERNVANMELVGGRPVVDFVNTLSDRALVNPLERLASYADLVSWALRVEAVSESEAGVLRRRAEAHPAEAAAVLERAVALREAIYRCFSARAAGMEMDAGDLEVVNREVAGAMAHLRVAPGTERCEWAWAGSDELDRVLWPIARSAAELLTGEELDRVKECAGDACGWLYLDTSRNRSRRWCDMKACGNRAKARRHYHRHRAGEGTDAADG